MEAFNDLGIPGASLNRIQVFFEVGDRAIALVLRARLPEGAVINYEAMRSVGYNLYLIERIE